jgi:NTE family protein
MDTQKAIIFQGGGGLGAYEAGVIKALYDKLSPGNEENKPLFDIAAGTSIGAINGAILVSQVLKNNGDWKTSIDNLQNFWTKRLSSDPDYESLWSAWFFQRDTPTAASEEAARRYYSVMRFFVDGAPNVFSQVKQEDDNRFYDNILNKLVHSDNAPLEKSIRKYADFPIATSFDQKQPRLLIVSVDVLEMSAVTFDSYKKEDGSRKSEYANYDKRKEEDDDDDKIKKFVIKYDDGISIDHVMASASVPGFYDYTKIKAEQSPVGDGSNSVQSTRYFWDGAILSNTPLREVIQAHRDYWTDVEKKPTPDLDVYVVDLWPSNGYKGTPPSDNNGIKDLQDMIQFSDKTIYDEKVAKITTDYIDLSRKLIELAKTKGATNEDIDTILNENAASASRSGENRQYRKLLEGRFNLSNILRIERSADPDSIYGKIGDFTSKTIKTLIQQGYDDTVHQFKPF